MSAGDWGASLLLSFELSSIRRFFPTDSFTHSATRQYYQMLVPSSAAMVLKVMATNRERIEAILVKRGIDPCNQMRVPSVWSELCLTSPSKWIQMFTITQAANVRWNPACWLCHARHRSQLGRHVSRVLNKAI